MVLQIISGGAGTGKTQRCMDLLLEEVSGGRAHEVLFLLYNNHQVQTVREFLRENLEAYIEPSLMTFQGLIREILYRGLSSPPSIAPENLALHLFRKAVEDCHLSYYRNAAQGGMLRLLKKVVDELKTNCVSPGSLFDATRKLPGDRAYTATLTKKAAELSDIYDRYQHLLRDYGYEEWPDAGLRTVELLRSEPEILKEKKLLLMDGFFYLTPWQKDILSAFFENLPRSVVTICRENGRLEVFSALEDMHAFLTGFSEAEVIHLEENMRAKAPALRHIEKYIFNPGAPPIPADESLSIYEAGPQDAEAELIARTIKRVVMEEDYHYQDFGVLLRSDSTYKDIFKQVFKRFDIPLIMSRHIDLKDVSSFRAVLTLLELAAGEWAGERVISFMRDAGTASDTQDLSPFPARVVDRIENTAIALGINDKKRWLDIFDPNSRNRGNQDTAKANAVREFVRLEEKIRNAQTARSLVGALSEVIGELYMLENAFVDSAAGTADGRSVCPDIKGPGVKIEAAAMVQLHALLSQFLALAEKDGNGTARPIELLEFINDSAETLSVEIPAEAQAGVWVSNIFESRVPEFRVAFVAGLQEGLFPPGFSEDPIFQDRERKLLNRKGNTLLQDRTALVDRERYLFYIALTRASERMTLTYPGMDSSGKKKLASFYLDDLLKLFTPQSITDRTSLVNTARILPFSHEIMSEDELVKFVVRGLNDELSQDDSAGQNKTSSLYNLALDRTPEMLRGTLIAANSEKPRSLNGGSTRYLVQRDKPYSISEIHTYGQCKFRYFCRYLLGLQPREEYFIDSAAEGDIYHEALRRIYLKPVQEKTTSSTVDGETFVLAGLEELEAVMRDNYARHLTTVRGNNLQERMKKVFRKFLETEYLFQKYGRTRPAYLELSFGGGTDEQEQDPRSTAEPLWLKSSKGEEVLLRGRIDRVDLVQSEGKTLGIVLDYKRGEGTINYDKMFRGEDIRLPLYMLAVERLLKVDAGGGLYYSIHKSTKKGVYLASAKDIEGVMEWGLRGKGGSSPEELSELLSEAEKTALERVTLIRKGEIEVRPINDLECRYCDYISVCRYDREAPGAVNGKDD